MQEKLHENLYMASITVQSLIMEEKNLVISLIAKDDDFVESNSETAFRVWFTERREILNKIKEQVNLYLGCESEDITLYANTYKKDISRPWQLSSLKEIEDCLQQVAVVFGGDFHPFAQAQRAHLRIMRKMVGKRPLILALECLFATDQQFVQDYLKGRISEDSFLENIQWDKKWGFSWTHYKPLFDFAENHGLEVLALNVEVDKRSGVSLGYRDQFAAKIIHGIHLQNPESLIYVLYGDLHIADSHLPGQFDKQFQDSGTVERASIYLNPERIYFDLVRERREIQVDVVRLSHRQFCIIGSPPWVKWQSYLMYLERTFDVDLGNKEDQWEWEVDYTDHVSRLVRMICTGLQVEIKTDDIEVYSPGDTRFPKLLEGLLEKKDSHLARNLIQSDQCFYIPQEGLFYLARITVNHTASLAGKYIHAHLCGHKRILWNFPEDFLRLIWIEAMGFLLSKFVNPKRKPQTLASLKKQLQAFDPEDIKREPLILALDHKAFEILQIYGGTKNQKTYIPVEKSSYIHGAHFLGEILGEHYFVLYQNKRIDRNGLKTILTHKINDKNFESFYFNQLKYLDKVEIEMGLNNESVVPE